MADLIDQECHQKMYLSYIQTFYFLTFNGRWCKQSDFVRERDKNDLRMLYDDVSSMRKYLVPVNFGLHHCQHKWSESTITNISDRIFLFISAPYLIHH